MANFETLTEQLNDAVLNARFRGPVDSRTVLADFAHAVDLFLTMSARAGLSREKQDGVLNAVHKLLSAKRSSIRYSDRYIIACQILTHAATPESVTCALYATSAAAALEYVLYAVEPQLVSTIVCDVALDGLWRSPSGNVVVLNRMNLLPVILPMVDIAEDDAALIDYSCSSMSTDVTVRPRGIDRSYASHLTQIVLTNEMLSGMPGNFRYFVNKLNSGMLTEVIESLYSNGKFVEQFAGISASHVRRCAEMLLGRDALLSAIDEVKVFDILCDSSRLPLLAAASTVNGGIEWLALKAFVPNKGHIHAFNPRESGRITSLGLKDLVTRL